RDHHAVGRLVQGHVVPLAERGRVSNVRVDLDHADRIGRMRPARAGDRGGYRRGEQVGAAGRWGGVQLADAEGHLRILGSTAQAAEPDGKCLYHLATPDAANHPDSPSLPPCRLGNRKAKSSVIQTWRLMK